LSVVLILLVVPVVALVEVLLSLPLQDLHLSLALQLVLFLDNSPQMLLSVI
jgi:hypothetical protein